MKRTEIEKKIQEINCLNNLVIFKYLPAMYENLKSIRNIHGQLMDEYAELVELHKNRTCKLGDLKC